MVKDRTKREDNVGVAKTGGVSTRVVTRDEMEALMRETPAFKACVKPEQATFYLDALMRYYRENISTQALHNAVPEIDKDVMLQILPEINEAAGRRVVYCNRSNGGAPAELRHTVLDLYTRAGMRSSVILEKYGVAVSTLHRWLAEDSKKPHRRSFSPKRVFHTKKAEEPAHPRRLKSKKYTKSEGFVEDLAVTLGARPGNSGKSELRFCPCCRTNLKAVAIAISGAKGTDEKLELRFCPCCGTDLKAVAVALNAYAEAAYRG